MEKLLKELVARYPDIKSCKNSIKKAVNILINTYEQGGKLLVCGNGGSAADSEHIVGELMKGFMKKRPLAPESKQEFTEKFPDQGLKLSRNLQEGLPAISLTSQTALMTAFSNDVSSEMVFAQQVYVYGNKEDTVLGISTSGNSENVVKALQTAAVKGLNTIGLSGRNGGKMKEICDINIIIPLDNTPQIQERHLPVYHTLCQMVETYFFQE